MMGSEYGHYGKQSQEICWTQLKKLHLLPNTTLQYIHLLGSTCICSQSVFRIDKIHSLSVETWVCPGWLLPSRTCPESLFKEVFRRWYHQNNFSWLCSILSATQICECHSWPVCDLVNRTQKCQYHICSSFALVYIVLVHAQTTFGKAHLGY